MTTTDSNGLIQYQTTDNVVPLQTAFNGLSSSVSTALNSTVRTFKVASDTERNALATTRVPSASNPLVVFNSASGKGYHEINTGSGWSRLIPDTSGTRLGLEDTASRSITTSTGATLGTVTVNTAGTYLAYYRARFRPAGNAAGNLYLTLNGSEVSGSNIMWHSDGTDRDQWPSNTCPLSLVKGNTVGLVSGPSGTGSTSTTVSYGVLSLISL